MRRVGRVLATASVFAVALIGWKVYVELAGVSSFVLPPPEDVATAALELLGEARTWRHTWVTIQEIIAGFVIAILTAVPMGVVLGASPRVERAINPLMVTLQVVPKVALVPLFILWFGFGIFSKMLLAAIFAFFPIAVATLAGMRSVEPGHRDLAEVLDASRRQRLAYIEFPSALPSLLTGLEVAIVLATVGAVIGEYLGGTAGLGWLALTSMNELRVDRLFGVVAILAALGYVLFRSTALLRKLLIPWHPSAHEEHGHPAL